MLRHRRSGADRRGHRRQAGSRWRRTRRTRARRAAAALLLGVAVLLGLAVLRPAPASVGEPTVVAARALPAGALVGPADVRVERRPAEHRPASAFRTLDAVLGQTTAVAITARDVVTPERLVGPDLLSGQAPGRLAMTVPVVGAGLAGVQPGTRVDVFATGTGSRVAEDVLVLAVSGGPSAGSGPGSSAGGAGSGIGSAPTMSFGDEPVPAVTLSLAPDAAAAVAQHLSALAAGESLVLAVHSRS